MSKKKPRQLYFKLFWTYVVVIFCIVISMIIYFVSALIKDTLKNRQENARHISKEAAAFVKEDSNAADYLYGEVYRENQLENFIAYLDLSPGGYQAYSLNEYSQSNNQQYREVEGFTISAFEAYPGLEKVELISYERNRVSTYMRQKQIYPYRDATERIRQIQDPGYVLKGSLQFTKNIINPETRKQEGALVFTFSCDDYIREMASKRTYIDIVILKNNENLVCVSKNVVDWKKLKLHDAKGQGISGFDIYKEQQDNYQIYTVLDRKATSTISIPPLLAIIGVGMLIFGSGVFCINIYIKRLTHRVEVIVSGMEQVTTGNLQVSLTVNKNGDELDMIARNFNEMCRKLDDYIQKSYLAEIEKKNSELQALQSQINPHFLYNTLEAIRMKAICNGDRDVGRMLYSMSVLFRSQLKEADWITVGQELDYCKQYLELFEYRYHGIFTYKIDCPVELMSTKVIKFILQPIIENYFIHGIRREDSDNEIYLRVCQGGSDLEFQVKDNGMGMEETLLQQTNNELEKNKYRKTQSVGIENVNRRIKSVYGNSFGIILNSEGKGLSVIIKVRMEEGEL